MSDTVVLSNWTRGLSLMIAFSICIAGIAVCAWNDHRQSKRGNR